MAVSQLRGTIGLALMVSTLLLLAGCGASSRVPTPTAQPVSQSVVLNPPSSPSPAMAQPSPVASPSALSQPTPLTPGAVPEPGPTLGERGAALTPGPSPTLGERGAALTPGPSPTLGERG
ncbi:MAG: hypothetical protein HYY04_05590, partial [Chloroflexi bacterium]|nr:hypothetical protein [Chloroflexota bacterium]